MNHLKDEEIISYYNHKLEQNEESNLLNHVSQCLVCAEKFANLFPVEELISPTDNLKYDEKNQKIIKTNGEIHKTKANIIPLNKYKNRKTELILYSSKVVAAAGIAVLMVFNMDSIKPNLVGTKIETMKKQIRKSARNRTLYCGYIWRIK